MNCQKLDYFSRSSLNLAKHYHSLQAHRFKIHNKKGPRMGNGTEQIIELQSINSSINLKMTGKIKKRTKRPVEGRRFCIQRTDSDAGRSKFFQSGRKRTADGALSSASRTNLDVGREKFLKSGRRRAPDEGGPSRSHESWY